LLFNFALEYKYAIRRVQVNQDGLKLSGTQQLLVYADDVTTLGGRVHTVQKIKEASLVFSKETGLEVNAVKPRHIVMSRNQDAERSNTVKIDNIFFEGWKNTTFCEQL
jgi:hypothetical protein